MNESSDTAVKESEEEFVTLEFYVGDSDEIDFTTDIPKTTFDILVADAEERGVTLEHVILDAVRALPGVGKGSKKGEGQ